MCIKKSVNKIFLIFKYSCVNFVILKNVVDLDYFLQVFRNDSVKQIFKTVLLQCLCKILLKLSHQVGFAYINNFQLFSLAVFYSHPSANCCSVFICLLCMSSLEECLELTWLLHLSLVCSYELQLPRLNTRAALGAAQQQERPFPALGCMESVLPDNVFMAHLDLRVPEGQLMLLISCNRNRKLHCRIKVSDRHSIPGRRSRVGGQVKQVI